MSTNSISEQEIRDILGKILKRREFHLEGRQNPVGRLLNSIWESVKEWIRQVFQYTPDYKIQINTSLDNPVLQTVLRILLILVAAVLLFFLLSFMIRKVYLARRINKSQVPKVYDYLEKPEEAMEKYYGYMSAGEYSKALRFLFIALLLEFGKRKIIKIEKWKTNRVYIREIGLNDKSLVSPMQEFSSLFNECCYGNRAVDEASVGKWFEFYMKQKEKPV